MNTKILLFLAALLPFPLEVHAKKSSPAAPIVKQLSKARFEVSKRAVEKEIRDPAAELATFTALPSFSNGPLSGLELSGFKPGCRLPAFGFKNGDVVEMVNGVPIRTPLDIMEVGQQLAKSKPGAKVRVHVNRGGEDLVLNYLLVD